MRGGTLRVQQPSTDPRIESSLFATELDELRMSELPVDNLALFGIPIRTSEKIVHTTRIPC